MIKQPTEKVITIKSDTMTTAPVIAGLAAGIGFVVLFAVMFNAVETMPRNSFDLAIAIAGLKDSYSIGEAIDFTVTVKGYGTACGYPNVLIKNVATNATVWSADRIVLVLCDPDPHNVDIVWKPEGWGQFPIVINEPGSYTVQAEFGNNILTEEFVVAST
jgi:hypothetical protein